jgi:inorganic pyrophosphatase
MPIRNLMQSARKFEIQPYRRVKDTKCLAKTHVAYSGWPQKHPSDDARIILVADPFSHNTFYYEFETTDIGLIESLPSIVTLDNQTLLMARVWVRKGALAIRSTPFLVAETND